MKGLANFNGIARWYETLEAATFGTRLWQCRCGFLNELKTRRSALVLGDGDGRFTARLLDENPMVLVDAVDASVEMLRALVRNAGKRAGRVRIRLADAREWEPEGESYDLIVTHFFLDCLTTVEVAALAERLRKHVRPDALWVISEFAIPDGLYGRLVAWPLVQALYLAFFVLTGLRVQRLPRWREVMEAAGFARIAERRFVGGLLQSELWRPEAR